MSTRDYIYTKKCYRGCPQGSVLSPTLWNIAIDDGLRSRFPMGIKVIAFTDDIVLYLCGKNILNEKINWKY